jgi:hypothetical protein
VIRPPHTSENCKRPIQKKTYIKTSEIMEDNVMHYPLETKQGLYRKEDDDKMHTYSIDKQSIP